jgi:hypothetical protein
MQRDNRRNVFPRSSLEYGRRCRSKRIVDVDDIGSSLPDRLADAALRGARPDRRDGKARIAAEGR